jgi:hypothetical protein
MNALRIGLSGLYAAAIMLGLAFGSAMAADDSNLPPHKMPAPPEPAGNSHANLAEAATNPLANLVQLQLQDQYNWENHNSSGYSNQFIIQPVVPVKLPWEAVPLLITRTTLPYVSTPNLGSPEHRHHGFGDTTFLAIANPVLPKGNAGGLGVSTVIPTGGDNDFTGSGKWSAGPAYAYIYTGIPTWQLGFFGWQHWSYASTSSGSGREDVNEHSIQPLITKHFSEGWYVASQDVPWKYNFKSDNWTMPMGPQVGKVFKIGNQPIKMFGAVYYDPYDDGANAEWTAKLNLTFLFPE